MRLASHSIISLAVTTSSPQAALLPGLIHICYFVPIHLRDDRCRVNSLSSSLLKSMRAISWAIIPAQ